MDYGQTDSRAVGTAWLNWPIWRVRRVACARASLAGRGRLSNRLRRFTTAASLMLGAALAMAAFSASLAQQPSPRFELKSPAFHEGGTIPRQFTCKGENRSPFLFWNEPPRGTRTFVLIVDDPDAPSGTWVHWVVYNLPSSARNLPEHIPAGDAIAGGARQGMNDFPQTGYGGPCPPPGKPHRYYFRLYALDTTLNLRSPVRRGDVDDAMKGHVLAQTDLMGTFGR